MNAPESKLVHLLQCLLRGPALERHAISRDHHARPVIAQPAMHKDLFPGIVVHYFQEPHKRFILRKWTVPPDGHIFHTQLVHHFAFGVVLAAACVHNNINAHPRQSVQPLTAGLPAAIKREQASSRHESDVVGHAVLLSGRDHDVAQRLAADKAVYVLRHLGPAPCHHALGPARAMRRHDDIGQFVERMA